MGKIDWHSWHHPKWNTMLPHTEIIRVEIWKHTQVVMMDVYREVRRQYGVSFILTRP